MAATFVSWKKHDWRHIGYYYSWRMNTMLIVHFHEAREDFDWPFLGWIWECEGNNQIICNNKLMIHFINKSQAGILIKACLNL